MQYFGDASGNLRNVLHGREEVFSIAVVAGPPFAVGACPKRVVRKNSILEEAKWSHLKDTSKRRMLECLSDREEDLIFNFATVSRDELIGMDGHYHLFNEGSLPTSSDVFLKSLLYAVLLDDIRSKQQNQNAKFYFDQFASRPSWENLERLLGESVPTIDHRHGDSKSRAGIQTADCIAGAARHDRLDNSSWLELLPEQRATDVSTVAISGIQQRLREL
ncbi:DUF3800 domain-containing protein [Halanaeroarchaeum sulfurireducens]|uniref:DUF3800 domain-containing protein n=1 Tax=Halanaeroarchaeum sulfurireducens TaxID=1604004 RepID=A0A0F7PA83_9EURY|nr:hypothetical protein HLASF_0015 [Halanaeroarchaeum sulfurireducens]ALG80931.1 hypothetical protein HLASA_0015 [Halanaeroarchaeum sulfurireducens]